VGNFAKVIGMDISIIEAIIDGSHHINIHDAEHLESALGVSSGYWLNLQKRYDKWVKSGPTQRAADASPVETCEHGSRMGECYTEICSFNRYGARR
jgi:plasmid maintenance system antidote protein VapI